jgi:hypothetical protein
MITQAYFLQHTHSHTTVTLAKNLTHPTQQNLYNKLALMDHQRNWIKTLIPQEICSWFTSQTVTWWTQQVCALYLLCTSLDVIIRAHVHILSARVPQPGINMGQNINWLNLFTMHFHVTHSKGTIKVHTRTSSNTCFIKAYHMPQSLYNTRHNTKIKQKYVSWCKVSHYWRVLLCHITQVRGNNLYSFLCWLNYFSLMTADVRIFTQTQQIKTISIQYSALLTDARARHEKYTTQDTAACPSIPEHTKQPKLSGRNSKIMTLQLAYTMLRRLGMRGCSTPTNYTTNLYITSTAVTTVHSTASMRYTSKHVCAFLVVCN